LPIPEQPFHGGVIAFNPIVTPLSVDVPDAVEMWIIPMIDFANDALMGSDAGGGRILR